MYIQTYVHPWWGSLEGGLSYFVSTLGSLRMEFTIDVYSLHIRKHVFTQP